MLIRNTQRQNDHKKIQRENREDAAVLMAHRSYLYIKNEGKTKNSNNDYSVNVEVRGDFYLLLEAFLLCIIFFFNLNLIYFIKDTYTQQLKNSRVPEGLKRQTEVSIPSLFTQIPASQRPMFAIL